jgi:hypothetical protein
VNAKLSMENPDWHTPAPIVEAARAVLGGIDLDPASDAEANQVIQAATIFTEDDNGLYEEGGETKHHRAWHGRVFCNPPGGMTRQFWNAFVLQWLLGNMTAGIWIGYSLEQLQSLQQGVTDQIERTARVVPTDYPMCVPSRRLAFNENEARRLSRMAIERVKIEHEIREVEAKLEWETSDLATVSLNRKLARLRRRQPKTAAGSPTHGNYIVYAGPDVEKFVEVFSAIGAVAVPR